jgi:hypothetical protein
VRVNEHKRNWQKMKREKEKGLEADTISSLLACHAVEQDHKVLWDDVNILAKEPNTKRRKIHEADAMYLEEEAISQPSCELPALWNPILVREEKMEIVRERKPKIREQVGNTERSKKKGREMEEEPAEMERGKKARIQGQRTVARVRATEQSTSTISELFGDVRVDILSLMMGTAISVSEASLVFNLF